MHLQIQFKQNSILNNLILNDVIFVLATVPSIAEIVELKRENN